jgi:transcriptional regulator with XRE-family HTH domain
MSFAQRLKEARKNAGLSQQQLGDRVGVSRTTVVTMENSEKDTQFPNYIIVQKCATALQVSLDWLRYGDEAKDWQKRVVFDQEDYTISSAVRWRQQDVVAWLQSIIPKNPQGVFKMASQEKIQQAEKFLFPVENNVMFDHNNVNKSLMIGDWALVNPSLIPHLKSGQIVLAQFGASDNFRFRQYTIDGNEAYLSVTGQQQERFPFDENVRVLGVVTAIERKLI